MAKYPPLNWSLVTLASLVCWLISALILSNGLDDTSIALALRVSSVTTALPFLLVFGSGPLQRFAVTAHTGQWAQQHTRALWIVAAVSHLIHLWQIGQYYVLGNRCPLLVWAVTGPLWVVLVAFAALAIFRAGWVMRAQPPWLYQVGSWYTWLVFTVAFGLSSVAQHLLFYNLPAAVLFMAAAVLRVLPQRPISAH